MKLSQIVESQRGNIIAYVKEMENGLTHEVRETKDRILGYLFGLNAGGLVAGAAYIAQKGRNCLVAVAMVLFVLGLASAVVRAAVDYFDCEAMARSIRMDVGKFYQDEMEWEQFLVSRKQARPDWHYYGLGIASGVLFFIGLIIGTAGCIIGLSVSAM